MLLPVIFNTGSKVVSGKKFKMYQFIGKGGIGMRKLLKHFIKNEHGQSIVELAVTIPILLLVLCAIVDFGWIFSNKMFITFCSREGARYGAVNATETNATTLITQKVMNTAPTYLKDKLTVEVSFTDQYDIRDGDIKVKIICHIKALTPITGIFTTDQEVELNSECIMKVE